MVSRDPTLDYNKVWQTMVREEIAKTAKELLHQKNAAVQHFNNVYANPNHTKLELFIAARDAAALELERAKYYHPVPDLPGIGSAISMLYLAIREISPKHAEQVIPQKG